MLNYCVEVEEPDRTFERHEEKCAKRTAEVLVKSAKLQALIEESRRRLALLDGLAEANDGVTAAYTDINLTAPAFSILGSSFVDPAFSSKTRDLMEGMYVNETSLCAEVLPTLQYHSWLGNLEGAGVVPHPDRDVHRRVGPARQGATLPCGRGSGDRPHDHCLR